MTMDLPTFEGNLDRHGGDLDRWPADLRDGALAFLDACEDAARSLAAMRDVERFLQMRPAPSDDRRAPVAAASMRHRQNDRSRRVAARLGWGATASLVLFLGLAIGTNALHQHEENPERVIAVALDGPVADYGE